MATIKPKFKLGQMVWYIANGYVANSTIKAVFITQHDEIVYTTDKPYYKYDREGSDHHYRIGYEEVLCEENLFTSREALAKYIKEQEDDE